MRTLFTFAPAVALDDEGAVTGLDPQPLIACRDLGPSSAGAPADVIHAHAVDDHRLASGVSSCGVGRMDSQAANSKPISSGEGFALEAAKVS